MREEKDAVTTFGDSFVVRSLTQDLIGRCAYRSSVVDGTDDAYDEMGTSNVSSMMGNEELAD